MLSDDRTAAFTTAGELLTNDPSVESELVYLIERTKGGFENLTPAEFRKRVAGSK